MNRNTILGLVLAPIAHAIASTAGTGIVWVMAFPALLTGGVRLTSYLVFGPCC